MRSRSTGPAAEEEGNTSRSNVDVISPVIAAGGFTAKLDAPTTRELKSLQTTTRTSTHQRASAELDRRKSLDNRPSVARSRHSSNSNWKVSEPRNAVTDKRPSLTETAVIGVPSPAAMANNKETELRSTVRRSRLRSPWASSLLILATTALAALTLFSIIHSFNTRQLDCKGCRMSYMRPSFAKLSEFDTEHTRFASKYSLYLYREGMIDEDTKV